jgi:hypothetical protein
LQPSRFTIAILQRALSFLAGKPNVAFRGTSESEFAEKSLEKMGIPRDKRECHQYDATCDATAAVF